MTERSIDPDPDTSLRRSAGRVRLQRGLIELAVIAVLYVGYSASRLFASDAFAPARGTALDLLEVESTLRLDVEHWLNTQFVEHDWLGVFGSFWYATTHYLVTAGVLLWIYRRSASQYVTARRALVVATLIGLAFYLTVPVAPPRMVDGYVDVLNLHSGVGWWGADASAPQGLGSMTNELAAFPSLHAGWALWVALVLVRAGVPRGVRVAGFAYTAVMAIVIIGTANHWFIDAIAGWVVVLVGFGLVTAWERRSPVVAHEDRLPAP